MLDGSDSTYFDHRRYTDSSNYLGGHYVSGGTEKPNNSVFGAGKFKVAMLSGGNLGFGGSWNDVMWISTYSGGDVKSSHALVFDKYSSNVWVSDQDFDSASWGTGYLLITSANIGSQSVNYATGAGNADTVDGLHSSSFVQTSNNLSLNGDSRNTRGVTRLYRRDDNSDYSVQTYWTGSYWHLDGYNGDNYHAGVQVAYADSAGNSDTVDGLHGSQFLRKDVTDTMFSGKTSALAFEDQGSFFRFG